MSPAGRDRIFELSAAGNDFLVVPLLDEDRPDWDAARVRAACGGDPARAADGVVLLGASSVATARFVLRNRDGSRAAFSGNGARCAARVLHHLGLAPDGRVTLETDGGVVAAHVEAGPPDEAWEVAVEIAPPRDVRPALRLPPGAPAPSGDYAVVGVPYLAVPVRDVDALDLASAAPPLRRWSAFPEGANVAFYEPPASPEAAVRLRTWERGVEGETPSSGTGCAMVAVSLALRGGALRRDGERVTTFAPRSSATLRVTLRVAAGAVTHLLLSGPVREKSAQS